jgi:hypothetical protein
METDYPTDAQITKFNANGQQIWTRRFDSGTNDLEYRVAVDSLGDIYIAGSSGGLGSSERDVKLVKYGANGQRRWIKTIGSSGQDNCYGITVDDEDNVILTGMTYGPLFGPDPANTNRDAWVAKYDSNGLQLWGRQLDATPSTRLAYGNAVTTDADGNVLVVGETTGRIPGSTQDGDLWVASLRGANGNTRWVRQFTLAANGEYANAVAVDSTGSVYVTGQSRISSSADAFLRKYSPAGVFRWNTVLDPGDGDGDGDGDVGFGVAVGLDDYIYVAGQTSGALNGSNRGNTDGFLAKFAPD